MYALWANLFDNPILIRELRRRMRGKALLYSIISYLFLMTLSTVLVMVFYTPTPSAGSTTEVLQRLQLTGETIFRWIVSIQALLVLIIAPTITAGMTTGEKERQTFDFLRVTTISRWMYVIGCFLSTAFYVGLALLCAMPLLALGFLYGGVSLEDVLNSFLLLLGTSCVLSAFGLYVSSITEKTRTAQGIIIFLIFGLIFSGLAAVQQYRMVFVGAGGGGAPTGLYIAGIPLQMWMLALAGFGFVTGVFLLVAQRKLFEPEETRAFSHWQFGVLFAGLLALMVAFLGGNTFANEGPAAVAFAFAFAVLMIGVMSFAIGRMEVGDEIWHLKRLVPVLRPFDQTIPFLLLIGAMWVFALSQAGELLGAAAFPPYALQAFMFVSTAFYFFLVMVGRASTGITGSRVKSFRITMATFVGLLVVVPVAAAVVDFAIPVLDVFWAETSFLSPLALLIRAVIEPTYFNSSPYSGAMAAGLLAAAGLGVGAFGEYKRWKRWRNFDYHYDMPVG